MAILFDGSGTVNETGTNGGISATSIPILLEFPTSSE